MALTASRSDFVLISGQFARHPAETDKSHDRMKLQGPLLLIRLATFGLAAPWLLAGALYLGYGLKVRQARLELDEFTAVVEAKARKDSWVRVPAGSGYIHLFRPPPMAPEDRARLESLSERYRNVEFRDALAEQFVVRGGWILLVLGACHVLLARIDRRATESTTVGEG